MAKGYVASFVKRDGKWLLDWVDVNEPGVRRKKAMERARQFLGNHRRWPGPALAERRMVFIDALCPDGRELVEALAAALRDAGEVSE